MISVLRKHVNLGTSQRGVRAIDENCFDRMLIKGHGTWKLIYSLFLYCFSGLFHRTGVPQGGSVVSAIAHIGSWHVVISRWRQERPWPNDCYNVDGRRIVDDNSHERNVVSAKNIKRDPYCPSKQVIPGCQSEKELGGESSMTARIKETYFPVKNLDGIDMTLREKSSQDVSVKQSFLILIYRTKTLHLPRNSSNRKKQRWELMHKSKRHTRPSKVT